MTAPFLAIVDDDIGIQESLSGLLRALGYDVVTFGSAQAFLAFPERASVRCLVLDVQMPGMTGPQLQARLATAGTSPPIVFITSHDDARVRSAVLAAGAVAFLTKPFSEEALLEALATAGVRV